MDEKWFWCRRGINRKPHCCGIAVLLLLIVLIAPGCDFVSRTMWQREGTIVTGTVAQEYSAQEPTVLLDGGLFKMWYTCGWNVGNTCYTTSSDGIHWNAGMLLPDLSGLKHTFVFKNDATYYFYGSDGTSFYRFHSSDGLTWKLDGFGILPANGTGWESQYAGNITVWISGGTWYALHEASGNDWTIGLATSSDGLTWTEYAGNPVIGGSVKGGCGGPEMHQTGSTYAAWIHCGGQPTDIFVATSTDLHRWTIQPYAQLYRMTSDEGVSSSQGQVADPSLVEVGTSTYLFYSATNTQYPSATDAIHIKLAIAPFTMTQLVSGKISH